MSSQCSSKRKNAILTRSRRFRKLIGIAAARGHEGVVRLLIKLDINLKYMNGETPLSLAVHDGYKNTVDILGRQNPPPVGFATWFGIMQLFNAARDGKGDLVRQHLAQADILADVVNHKYENAIDDHSGERP
jgi:hypothetical protein